QPLQQVLPHLVLDRPPPVPGRTQLLDRPGQPVRRPVSDTCAGGRGGMHGAESRSSPPARTEDQPTLWTRPGRVPCRPCFWSGRLPEVVPVSGQRPSFSRGACREPCACGDGPLSAGPAGEAVLGLAHAGTGRRASPPGGASRR